MEYVISYAGYKYYLGWMKTKAVCRIDGIGRWSLVRVKRTDGDAAKALHAAGCFMNFNIDWVQ